MPEIDVAAIRAEYKLFRVPGLRGVAQVLALCNAVERLTAERDEAYAAIKRVTTLADKFEVDTSCGRTVARAIAAEISGALATPEVRNA